MRGRVTLFAFGISLFGASWAGTQEAGNITARSAQDASPQPKTRTAVADARTAREQAIFKEWAKAIRESVDASKKLKRRTQTERTAWAMHTATLKEDKIRKRYRLNLYQLFLIIKRGVAEKWPTDKPEDLAIAAERQAFFDSMMAQRQAFFDSMVFEEELSAWVTAHWPSTPAHTTSLRGLASEIQTAALDQPRIARELREIAPITICGARLPDGKTCNRKVVGDPGRLCYEHRATTDHPTRD